MKKKILSLLMASAMLMSCLSGCGGNENHSDQGDSNDDMARLEINGTVIEIGIPEEPFDGVLVDGTTLIVGALCEYSYGTSISQYYNSLEEEDYQEIVESITEIVIQDGASAIPEQAASSFPNVESVEIPDSVTAINDFAFWSCSKLKDIEIPDGVTYIGESAFHGCDSLREIEIPNGVTFIGENAFYNCSSIEILEIPDSVTTIESSAFFGCTNLVSIKLPNGLTVVDNSLLAGCTNLKEVTIPNSVIELGSHVFGGCLNLERIEILNSEVEFSVYFDKGRFPENVTIYAPAGSTAEEYAKRRDIPFVVLENE